MLFVKPTENYPVLMNQLHNNDNAKSSILRNQLNKMLKNYSIRGWQIGINNTSRLLLKEKRY